MAKQRPTHSIIWLKENGERRDEERYNEPPAPDLIKFVDGELEMYAKADYIFIVNEDGRRDGKGHNAIASKMYGSPLLGNVVVIKKL